jgi:hypothetical protein
MTNMQFHLSYARFFAAKEHFPEVDEVLHHCVARKYCLRLSLDAAGVSLSASGAEQARPVLSLTGRWRSPLLEGAHQGSALLLVPFILLIEELSLPAGSLYTLGRRDQSVADLFMRNFFYAACRSERMTFRTVAESANAAVTDGSRELTQTYLQIARACLKDSVFERGNAPELIVACAHLPVLKFSNPLLEAGAAELRRVSAQASRQSGFSGQGRAAAAAPQPVLAT